MDAIEKAIRNALQKGNAEDRAFREKVYRSVFAALERNIQSSPLEPDAAQRRRDALAAMITEIEQEFIPAIGIETPDITPVTPGPAVAPSVYLAEISPHAAQPGRLEPAFPDLGSPAEPEMHREQVHVEGNARSEGEAFIAATPGIDRERMSRPLRERRRSGRWMTFSVLTLVATVAIGAWILFELGLLRSPGTVSLPGLPTIQGRSGETPSATPPLGPAKADASRDWVTVFSPQDPVSVSAPAGSRADIVQEEGLSLLRIRSGPKGEAVVFDVGQGILERLAGHSAVFDVVARAPDDEETEISIDCNFGELGGCGRRRYMVGPGRAEYLFDMNLQNVRPGSAGTISITSDVSNAGKPVDIYEIKVSISD